MESTGDTSRSGLWRFARLLSISFVSFWFVIGCISWYFVTSPIWIAPFWSAAGTLVFLMGLIAMLGFRASLVGLRFGLLENHHGAATSELLDALPLLVVEWVTYILMAVACSFSLISVLPLYHAIAISAGATFASI